MSFHIKRKTPACLRCRPTSCPGLQIESAVSQKYATSKPAQLTACVRMKKGRDKSHRPSHLIDFLAAMLPTPTMPGRWSTAGLRNRTAGLVAFVMSETLKQATQQTTATRLRAGRTAWGGCIAWLRNRAANGCRCIVNSNRLTAGLWTAGFRTTRLAAGSAPKATEQSSFSTLRSQNIAQQSNSQN